MALYMVQGTYTAEAWAALAKNPQDRRIPIKGNSAEARRSVDRRILLLWGIRRGRAR
jgi:hypothetical protein